MLCKQKTAMIAKTAFLLILLLLASTAVIGSQLRLFSSDTLEQEALPCKIMLEAQDLTDTAIFMGGFENDCQTLKKQLPLNKKTETVEEVEAEIADLMALTWWTVHEGRIDELWGDSLLGLQYNCFIRYTIDFNRQNSATDNLHIPRDQFVNYLDTTKYNKVKNGELSFMDYFTSYGGEPTLVVILPNSTSPDYNHIDTAKSYAISVMSLHKGNAYLKLFNPLSPILNVLADYLPTVLVFSTLDFAQNQLDCKTVQANTY